MKSEIIKNAREALPGGHIRVESGKGYGTSVIIDMPARAQ